MGENDLQKVEACTSTSSTYTIPNSTIGDLNYSQYCLYRLPCGICTRTNSICPLSGNCITTPSWGTIA